MEDLLQKISSYHIFNYIVPGIVLSLMVTIFTSFNFTHENVVVYLFSCYFLGLILSRISSLIIDPILEKVKFIRKADYKDYLDACKKDNKLDSLSEVNNMYRTLTAMPFVFLVIVLYEFLYERFYFFEKYSYLVIILILLIIFLYSYKKQTKYITRRINKTLNK